MTRRLSLPVGAALLISLFLGLGVTVRSETAGLSATARNALLARLKKAEGAKGVAAFVVADLESGVELFSYRADEMLAPASNMKLLTSAAALSELGADFEFVTRVMARGEISEGTLTGDLCLIGSGDPNLSGRFHEDEPLKLFKDWALKIKKKGITKVSGDLLYDSTLFGGPAFSEAWPEDGQYLKWYCAQVSALAFNDNCIGVRVLPTKAGERGKIELVPPTDYVTVVNRTMTAKGRAGAEIGILRPRGSNTITVKGKVFEKATWGYFTDVTVDDPARYAAHVFRGALKAEGILVAGMRPFTMTAKELPEFKTLVEHRAKLIQALGPVNTNSQNLHAEMLFRQLGLKYAGQGSFKTGRAAVLDFLRKQGLETKGVEIIDGSGLAKSNRLSAHLLTNLLLKMSSRKDFKHFRSSLAIGGETGTLRKRFRKAPLRGRVRAKTGYIAGVRALSGYLETEGGSFVFSILMNNCANSKAAQDDLLGILAEGAK